MDAPHPTADTMLAELASLGMRAARVVTRMMEIEAQAAELVAASMPQPGSVAPLSHDMVIALQGVDIYAAHMADAAPRTQKLARALAQLERMVRQDLALQRRIAAGWTGMRADTQATMTKRHVARQVGEAIRQQTDGEAAERLFDDLAERLDDPAIEAEIATLPVPELVLKLCRDLGLATAAMEAALRPGATIPGPPPDDSG